MGIRPVGIFQPCFFFPASLKATSEMSDKNNKCRQDEYFYGKCGLREGHTTTTLTGKLAKREQKKKKKKAKQKRLIT